MSIRQQSGLLKLQADSTELAEHHVSNERLSHFQLMPLDVACLKAPRISDLLNKPCIKAPAD